MKREFGKLFSARLRRLRREYADLQRLRRELYGAEQRSGTQPVKEGKAETASVRLADGDGGINVRNGRSR
jgi:hypothetical protein